MLSILILATSGTWAQKLGPDYFATYWATANARSMGMGKSLAGVYDHPSAVMLNAAGNSGYSGLGFTFGGGLNIFPDLPNAQTTHLAGIGGMASKVVVGFAYNSFSTGTFEYINDQNLKETDNLRFSNAVINVILRSKSGPQYGFNVEFFNVDGNSVIAAGIGLGDEISVLDNDRHSLSFRYSAGLNGANLVLNYIAAALDLKVKEPPAKAILGTSITHTLKNAGWGYNGSRAGLDVTQYLNYGTNTYARLGAEVGVLKYLLLRTGYFLEMGFSNGSQIHGPTGGIGIYIPITLAGGANQANLYLDWAVFPYPEYVDRLALTSREPIDFGQGAAQIISGTISVSL